MKAVILAVSTAALAVALPASAQVLTLMGSLAEGCYHAAENRDKSFQAIQTCDRAFNEQALTRDDEFATFVNRGILRMFRRDFEGAQSDFGRAIAMRPNRPEPWFNMGMLHLNNEDPARSIDSFTRAIELGMPKPELAYFGRGLAYEDAGNVKVAYADLQSARKLAPSWDAPAEQLKRYRVVQR